MMSLNQNRYSPALSELDVKPAVESIFGLDAAMIVVEVAAVFLS